MWVEWQIFAILRLMDGSEILYLPVEVGKGTLSNYLQGFIHPRWLFGISSINSICVVFVVLFSNIFENGI